MKKYCKKLMQSIIVFLFVVTMILPINYLNAQVNITLDNPGFEIEGRTPQEAYGWHPFHNGYERANYAHTGSWGIKLRSTNYTAMSGAYQRVNLNQETLKPVFIGGYVKGRWIRNSLKGYMGAGLYTEIHMNDGSIAYWNSIANYGTFNWRWIGFNTGTLNSVNKPIDHIFIVPILNKAYGIAYFDDIAVTEYNPEEGAVTIMIDDGESSTYTEAKPVLDKFEFDVSVAISTDLVEQTGYMNWDQLIDLSDSGWEIVSHGKTHKDLTLMNSIKAKRELRDSKQILESHGLTINNFAFPFGAYNGSLIARAAPYYKSTRAYEQGSNPLGSFPYDIKVRGVLITTTPAEVENWVNEVMANGRWMILNFHSIVDQGEDAYYTTPKIFNNMIQIIANSGVDVVTYDEGIDKYSAKK